jgi:hypothetical protein
MRCLGKKKYVDECKQNVYDCDWWIMNVNQ